MSKDVRTKRILVVDDEDNQVEDLVRALRNKGYEVERAMSRDQAINKLEKKGNAYFDYVITDLYMIEDALKEGLMLADTLKPFIEKAKAAKTEEDRRRLSSDTELHRALQSLKRILVRGLGVLRKSFDQSLL